MSYDYDADGNKVFYEQEDTTSDIDFDTWYAINSTSLQEEYIERNPDEMKTDEDMQDIEQNTGFQSFCEGEYETRK